MAYEIGAAPNSIAGQTDAALLEEVGSVPSYGIGASPDAIVGQLAAADVSAAGEVPDVVEGTGTLSGGGSLSATGEAIVPTVVVEGSGTLTGGGQLLATGVVVAFAGGSVGGDGSLLATGTAVTTDPNVVQGTVLLSGGGQLLATGTAVSTAPGVVVGTASLSGGGSLLATGTAFDPVAAPTILGPTQLEIVGEIMGGRRRPFLPMKQGDLLPVLELVLKDRNGVGVDLSGATVRVLVRRPDLTLAVDDEGTVVGSPGLVRRPWQDGETDATGNHNVEAEATWPDGRSLTFPNRGYALIYIGEDLGGVA